MTDSNQHPEDPMPTAEVVPATTHHQPAPVGLFAGAHSPAEQLEAAQETATVLATFVESQGLARKLSNRADARPYVQVEGWQFLGTALGLTATVDWTRKTDDHKPPAYRLEERRNRDGKTYTVRILETPGEGGWEARATVRRIGDDQIMGVGEAECLWAERNWSDRDSYALRSMAQTRAISKAYRGPLAFVMVLAGFAATPAEEMDGVVDRLDDDSYDGPRCPACDSPVWDNRAENEKRAKAGQKNMPAFKCRNKACTGSVGRDGDPEPWFTWSASHFEDEAHDYTNSAKEAVLQAVTEAGVDVALNDLQADDDLNLVFDVLGENAAKLREMIADEDTRTHGVAYALWLLLDRTAHEAGDPYSEDEKMTRAGRDRVKADARSYLGLGAEPEDEPDYGDGYY